MLADCRALVLAGAASAAAHLARNSHARLITLVARKPAKPFQRFPSQGFGQSERGELALDL